MLLLELTEPFLLLLFLLDSKLTLLLGLESFLLLSKFCLLSILLFLLSLASFFFLFLKALLLFVGLGKELLLLLAHPLLKLDVFSVGVADCSEVSRRLSLDNKGLKFLE